MDPVQKRALTKKRAIVKSRVTRISTFINAFQSGGNINDVKVREKLLVSSIDEYNEIQTELEVDNPGDSSLDTDREQFEELCLEIQSKCESLCAKESPSPLSTGTVNNTCALKLPTIALPNFSGNLRDFMHFYDTFDALIIKNESLSDIQRYYYLLSCLSGEAHRLIENLPVSLDNFKVAWDMIRNRYYNQKLISDLHIKELLNLPCAKHDSSKELRTLVNQISSNLNAVEALKIEVPLHEAMLSHLVLDRISVNMRKQWENKTSGDIQPRLTELIQFLETNCQTLDIVASARTISLSNDPAATHSSYNKVPRRTFIAASNCCPLCESTHQLHKCPEFNGLNVNDRINVVRKFTLCFNCLRADHRANNCKSTNCRHCNKRHHTMLHSDHNHRTTPRENQSCSVRATSHPQSEVLLSTAMVTLTGKNGGKHRVRALLDSGSQLNFITEKVVAKLGTPLKKYCVPVNGISNIKAAESSHLCQIQISSSSGSYTKHIVCSVLDQITGPLPSSRIAYDDWKIPSDIQLADPNFHEPMEIDLLLGATIFFDILRSGQLTREEHPTLQNTALGWVLSGCIPAKSMTQRQQSSTALLSIDDNLHSQVARFWEQEEIAAHTLPEKEHPCEQHFKMYYKRDENGRFEVRLPLHRDVTELGDSFNAARRNFGFLERRLQKNPELRREYLKFMDEYLKLEHMELVDASMDNTTCYYMPHHPVIKETSSTTKVRVVFNASQKTTSSMSLNNLMLVGPTVQQDLYAIVIRFRTHKYVLSADIEKMYRQIRVSVEDRDLQRILWRKSPNEPLKTYRLTTVTYGTASAPYLATRCLIQVATDGQKTHPSAAEITKRDFYVDDLLTGTDTVSNAIHIYKDITSLLKSAGFVIRKWQSNSPEVLKEIPISYRDTQKPCSLPTDQGTVKTLGLFWHPTTDEFQYQVSDVNYNENWTKRKVLGYVASIYDPLGLLGPVIIMCKVFIQIIWQRQLAWDDPLPVELSERWIDIQKQLPMLNNIRIPRRITEYENVRIELHGFSDASEKAYGACVYLRSVSLNGSARVQLITSKSRVAPLKQLTLPRLELNAACLLSHLMERVQAAIHLKVSQCYYWTDSTVVLAWISGCPSSWKTYVANRVSDIQQLTSIHDWKHVDSSDNPADIISRGATPLRLKDSCLWWAGPSWLSHDSSTWTSEENSAQLENIPERKREKLCVTALLGESNAYFTKFSSWTKLQRVMAYVLRFSHNSRTRKEYRTSGTLTTTEIRKASKVIVRIVQLSSYSQEVIKLQNGDPIPKNSKLLCLHPFLDSDCLLRVGGRLQKSEIPFDQMHPMILPPAHHVTKLIISNEHLKMLHGGTQLLLASLRQQYWILRGRSTIRSVIHKCINCFKVKSKVASQLMGQLPEARVTPSKPFSRCGVDYGGPLHVKYGNPRSKTLKKCYIAVFVCMSTKAVHIEMVTDLTTEAFIAALRRFVARRGRCNQIFSDNGTCFTGAKKVLDDWSRLVQSQNHQFSVARFTSQEGIDWKLIPPHSPHFGGLWEAGVKSVKNHIRKTVGNALLTLEELNTLLIQIEACMNSRPIIPLNDSPDDHSFLTPGHFLVGEPLISFHEPDCISESSRLSRWQQVQRCSNLIWKRWSSDYLSQLQQRAKWRHSQPNLLAGRLVLLKEDNTPPLTWRTGIIEETHPGSDGLVRVVTVRTSKGAYKRPITKIAPFPDELS